MSNQVNISLTVEQVNFVLSCVAKTPYEVSAGLISQIMAQAQPQIAAMPAPEETPAEGEEISSEEAQVLQ